jgi:hypothetical protein
MNATICSAVCAIGVAAYAVDVGGGAAAAAVDKLSKAKAANCIPTDSYILPLPFESEGYAPVRTAVAIKGAHAAGDACNEVMHLLMAWAKIWAQRAR